MFPLLGGGQGETHTWLGRCCPLHSLDTEFPPQVLERTCQECPSAVGWLGCALQLHETGRENQLWEMQMPSAGMLQGEMKANSICISSVTLDVFPFPFRLEFTYTHTHTLFCHRATQLPAAPPGSSAEIPTPNTELSEPTVVPCSIHSPCAALQGVGKEQSSGAVAHRHRGCALRGTQ